MAILHFTAITLTDNVLPRRGLQKVNANQHIVSPLDEAYRCAHILAARDPQASRT